jgi:hypothetical protein
MILAPPGESPPVLLQPACGISIWAIRTRGTHPSIARLRHKLSLGVLHIEHGIGSIHIRNPAGNRAFRLSWNLEPVSHRSGGTADRIVTPDGNTGELFASLPGHVPFLDIVPVR